MGGISGMWRLDGMIPGLRNEEGMAVIGCGPFRPMGGSDPILAMCIVYIIRL
jgi:hypothetical protein